MLLSIFQTVEFYVVLTVIAAAIAAYAALPAKRGEARLHLLAGDLESHVAEAGQRPAITLDVREDGAVILKRLGLEGVHADGAASLAVKLAGFDIEIEERLIVGRGRSDEPDPTSATFVIDFLGPDWYHIKYNSESIGRFCAVTLHVRPGIHISKPLAL